MKIYLIQYQQEMLVLLYIYPDGAHYKQLSPFENMKTVVFQLSIKSQRCYEELFLKDPNSDFYLICAQRIFPLHKRFLIPHSSFFSEVVKNSKVYELQSFHKIDIMEDILSLFYGNKIRIERSDKIIDYLEALLLLKFKDQPENIIIEDFSDNFDEYCVFTLLFLSRKFNLEFLEDKCIQSLRNEGFEQLNYNKYEFLQCDLDTFKFVIKQHQHHRKMGRFTGVSEQNLKILIEQYCIVNKISTTTEQIFQELLNPTTSVINDQNYSIYLNSRQFYSLNLEESNKCLKDESIQMNALSLSRSSSCSSQTMVSKIQKIKKLNQQILVRSVNMVQQMNQIQESISSSNQKLSQMNIKSIDTQLQKFKSQFSEQDQKLMALQQKFNAMSMRVNKKSPSVTQETYSLQSSPLKSANLLSIPNVPNLRPRRKSDQHCSNKLEIPVLQFSSELEFQ